MGGSAWQQPAASPAALPRLWSAEPSPTSSLLSLGGLGQQPPQVQPQQQVQPPQVHVQVSARVPVAADSLLEALQVQPPSSGVQVVPRATMAPDALFEALQAQLSQHLASQPPPPPGPPFVGGMYSGGGGEPW